MKYVILSAILATAACSANISAPQQEAKYEADRVAHQEYMEETYSNYDSEYVSDCLFYEDLVCPEFE
jgi:hypothetical protein